MPYGGSSIRTLASLLVSGALIASTAWDKPSQVVFQLSLSSPSESTSLLRCLFVCSSLLFMFYACSSLSVIFFSVLFIFLQNTMWSYLPYPTLAHMKCACQNFRQLVKRILEWKVLVSTIHFLIRLILHNLHNHTR